MAKKSRPVVAVVMGSESDAETMLEAGRVLKQFNVSYEAHVISAHRTPDRCRAFAHDAEKQGLKVIICGAGKAAHLAGVIASHTIVPVIGVPLDAGLGGMDALLSTVQMPRGVPVATVAVGTSGAANAGILAVAMLALEDKRLAAKLRGYRCRQAVDAVRASKRVSRQFAAK